MSGSDTESETYGDTEEKKEDHPRPNQQAKKPPQLQLAPVNLPYATLPNTQAKKRGRPKSTKSSSSRRHKTANQNAAAALSGTQQTVVNGESFNFTRMDPRVLELLQDKEGDELKTRVREFDVCKLLRPWTNGMKCPSNEKNCGGCLYRAKSLLSRPDKCEGGLKEVSTVFAVLEFLRQLCNQLGADNTFFRVENMDNIALWFDALNRLIGKNFNDEEGDHIVLAATPYEPEASDLWVAPTKRSQTYTFPTGYFIPFCGNALFYLFSCNVEHCHVKPPSTASGKVLTLADVVHRFVEKPVEYKQLRKKYLLPNAGYPNLSQYFMKREAPMGGVVKWNRNQSVQFNLLQFFEDYRVRFQGQDSGPAEWESVAKVYVGPSMKLPLMKRSVLKEKSGFARIPLDVKGRTIDSLFIVDHRLDRQQRLQGAYVPPQGWKELFDFDANQSTRQKNPYGDAFVSPCDTQLTDTLRVKLDDMCPSRPTQSLLMENSDLYSKIDVRKMKETLPKAEDHVTTVVEFPLKQNGILGGNDLYDAFGKDEQLNPLVSGLCEKISEMAVQVAQKSNPQQFSDKGKVNVTMTASFEVCLQEKLNVRVQVPHRENETSKLVRWQKDGIYKLLVIMPLDKKGVVFRLMMGSEEVDDDDYLMHILNGTMLMIPASAMKAGGFLTDRGGNPTLVLTVLVTNKELKLGKGQLKGLLSRKDGTIFVSTIPGRYKP